MLNELLKRPIIPVIVIEDANDAEPLAEALLAGGMAWFVSNLNRRYAMGACQGSI